MFWQPPYNFKVLQINNPPSSDKIVQYENRVPFQILCMELGVYKKIQQMGRDSKAFSDTFTTLGKGKPMLRERNV